MHLTSTSRRRSSRRSISPNSPRSANRKGSTIAAKFVMMSTFISVPIVTGYLFRALNPLNCLMAGVVYLLFGIFQCGTPSAATLTTGVGAHSARHSNGLRRGLVMGAIFTLVLAIAAQLINHLPASETFLDRDRPMIEAQVNALAGAGDFKAASQIVSQRISQPCSEAWRGQLQDQHIALLIKAGEAVSDPMAKKNAWNQAIELCAQYDRSASLPEALLANLTSAERHTAELVQQKAKIA